MQLNFLVSSILATLVTATDHKCEECPTGYSRFGGSCFKYLITPQNDIDQARAACVAENKDVHLIAPRSDSQANDTINFLSQKLSWPSDWPDVDPNGGPNRSAGCPEGMGPCTNFQWMDIGRKNTEANLAYFSDGTDITFTPSWFPGEPHETEDEPCLFYGHPVPAFGPRNFDFVCYPEAAAICEAPKTSATTCPDGFTFFYSMCLHLAKPDFITGSVQAATKACQLTNIADAKVVEPDTSEKNSHIHEFYLDALNGDPERQFWIGAYQFPIDTSSPITDRKKWYWISDTKIKTDKSEILFDGLPISHMNTTVPWMNMAGLNQRTRMNYIQMRGNGGVWKDVSAGNRGAGAVCTRLATNCEHTHSGDEHSDDIEANDVEANDESGGQTTVYAFSTILGLFMFFSSL